MPLTTVSKYADLPHFRHVYKFKEHGFEFDKHQLVLCHHINGLCMQHLSSTMRIDVK